jgi:hypothetical protein
MKVFAAINTIGKLVHGINSSVMRHVISKLVKTGISKYKLMDVCEEL